MMVQILELRHYFLFVCGNAAIRFQLLKRNVVVLILPPRRTTLETSSWLNVEVLDLDIGRPRLQALSDLVPQSFEGRRETRWKACDLIRIQPLIAIVPVDTASID